MSVLQRFTLLGIFLASSFAAMLWSNPAFSGCLSDSIDPHQEFFYDVSQNNLGEAQTCQQSESQVSGASCQCYTMAAQHVTALLNAQPSQPVAVSVYTAPNFSFSGSCRSALSACTSVCTMLAKEAECTSYVYAGITQ